MPLVDDTLAPRNDARFPVAHGAIWLAAFPFASFPVPSTYPAGTIIAASDQGYAVYMTSGVAWFQVSIGAVLPPSLNVAQQPPVTRTVYVRPGGNDVTGDGSLGNPYATVQHAVNTVPMVSKGVKYVIEITGYHGTEQLLIPQHLSGGVDDITFGGNPESPPFFQATYLTIQALPTPLYTLSNATTSSQDPNIGLSTFTDPNAVWGVNQFKGMFVVGSGILEMGVIESNTVNQLVTSSPLSIGDFTQPVRIMDVGGSISYGTGNVVMAPGCRLGLNGVALTPSGFHSSLFVGSVDATLCRLGPCNINGNGYLSTVRYSHIKAFSSPHSNFVMIGMPVAGIEFCYLDTVTLALVNGTLFGSLCDSCTIPNGDDFPVLSFDVEGCVFNASSIVVWPGYKLNVNNTAINNSVGSAITVYGTGTLILNDDGGYIIGTGNARYGLELLMGARVWSNPGNITATGTLGDLKVGALPVRSWADFNTNPPRYLQSDVFGDGSSFQYDFVVTPQVSVPYTPAVLANWSNVAPASMADALDRIAAKIGPIG